MRIIRAEKGKPIILGRFAEDDAMRVVFPLDEFASFDIKTIQLANQRNGDDDPYFCVVTKEGNELYWDVQKSDVSKLGLGKCEMIITFGEKGIAKSYIYETRVLESLGEAGDVPPPYQPWVDSVLSEFAFSHKLENITCRYISIPHSAEPHCDSEETEDGLILTFYIPQGDKGADGKDGKDGSDGKDGADGFTPSASVTKTGSTSTITITDKVGTTSVEVKDGEKGDKGDDYILTEQDKSEIASQISTEVKPVITNDLKAYIDSTYPILDEVAL